VQQPGTLASQAQMIFQDRKISWSILHQPDQKGCIVKTLTSPPLSARSHCKNRPNITMPTLPPTRVWRRACRNHSLSSLKKRNYQASHSAIDKQIFDEFLYGVSHD